MEEEEAAEHLLQSQVALTMPLMRMLDADADVGVGVGSNALLHQIISNEYEHY